MNHSREKFPVLVCSEIGLVRCLGDAGIPVITGTEETDNPAIYSRFSSRKIRFSSYESEHFIQQLCDLGKELEYKPVLMSYDDRLILNISRRRDELLKYFRFLLPEKEMVENLLNKLSFVALAEKYELPVPASFTIRSEADLQKVTGQLEGPYLIKPLYRHHWFHNDFSKIVGTYKKAFVCSTVEELLQLYRRIAQIHSEVVVQEYIEGPDDHMFDINLYIDANGEVRGGIVARKLRVFPPTAGYGSYVVTVDDPNLWNLSIKIAQNLGLVGLINIQFKKEAQTGEPRLIEIHPRTSIFDVLGIKAGMNLPALYYADMAGISFPVNGGCKPGVKYLNPVRDLQLFLKNRKNRDLNIWEMIGSYSGEKVIDGFSIKDPVPALLQIWGMMRKVFLNSN